MLFELGISISPIYLATLIVLHFSQYRKIETDNCGRTRRTVIFIFGLLEKRNEQRKSTIVCSQRDPASWKAMILNDEVSANSIMKRATKHYTIKINTR